MKSCSSTSDNLRHILLAPNAFKGSLSAIDFCRILAETFRCPPFHPVELPMFDGGDGTASCMAFYLNAVPHRHMAADALGRPHEITYYTKENTAIVDLAEVCGLKYLKPAEYDVFNANTRGLGLVLLHLAEEGYSSIILGLGGSASVDGGIGALEAMGLQTVKSGHLYGNPLLELEDFDASLLKKRFAGIKLLILCDVNNPLCGPEGAAQIFGPQKGATPQQVELLEERMLQFTGRLKERTSTDPQRLPHAGAAGGVAASFGALLDASLVSGSGYCLSASGFRELLPQASCVITGEGRLDSQSLYGKLPGEIAAVCRHYSKPLFAISGQAELPLPDFTGIYTLADYAPDLQASIEHPEIYLRQLAEDLKRTLLETI